MTVAFGKEQTLWGNNHQETELLKKMKPEIKRFGKLLKWIYRLEPLSVLIPIGKLLRLCGFSKEFANLMVFPLTALFFGTGNQTPYVSSAIVARVFLDPQLRLFEYNSEKLLTDEAEMFAFGELGDIYNRLVKNLTDKNVNISFNREIRKIIRFPDGIQAIDHLGAMEQFDEVIFTCDAETALRVMDCPTYLERKCLSAVRYYDDLTITHVDFDYMKKYYGADFDKDMYYIHTDPNDISSVEMSFNLVNYQPHLKSYADGYLFQTIFLDKNKSSSWTIDHIQKDKIISRHWWHQFAHVWTHFAFAVPLIRFIQGKKHCWFAGSWTLINTHEIAVISGLAAATRLGADYPFKEDDLAKQQFVQYMNIIQGANIDGTPKKLLPYVILFVVVLLLIIAFIITCLFLIF